MPAPTPEPVPDGQRPHGARGPDDQQQPAGTADPGPDAGRPA
jgi:hypothetical protein